MRVWPESGRKKITWIMFWILRLKEGGSCFARMPKSEKPDMGHPVFKAVFLKVWLSAARRETQIPFGNDNKNKDSASEEKAVRSIPSGKLLWRVLKKSPHGEKSVPQRLKPHCRGVACGTGKPVPLSNSKIHIPRRPFACGTAEAVPLSKTGFFSTLFFQPALLF